MALFTFQPDGLSIQRHSRSVAALIAAGADVIGSNCGGGPDLLYRVDAYGGAGASRSWPRPTPACPRWWTGA
ncbi:MAG: hypothetical protein R3F43_19365 [bacterium]